MENDQEIHTLVVGTGAVGGFYGSRLHQPSRKRYVSFVCRSNYEKVLNQGIQINSKSHGDYSVRPLKVFRTVKDAKEFVLRQNSSTTKKCKDQSTKGSEDGGETVKIRRWNYVILSTKVLLDQVDDSQIVKELFEDDSNNGNGEGLDRKSCLVLIQNGIGFEQVHRNRFPSSKILSAVTVINAEQVEPGLIRHNKWTRISVGPYFDFNYSNSQPQNRFESEKDDPSRLRRINELVHASDSDLRLFVTLLKEGGIRDAEMCDERGLQVLRWHKLAINASMNPTSVLAGGLTNSEMVKRPHLRQHLRDTMMEILEVGKQIFQIGEYPPKFASPDQILESTEKASLSAEKEGKVGGEEITIKPSMLMDWENGKELEIEAILGFPARVAKNFGFKLSRVETMYALLAELQGARDRKLWRIKTAKM